MIWLTLLLCMELIDGTIQCSPRTLEHPLASQSECLRVAAAMLRSQAEAPEGYRLLLPRPPLSTCSAQRPPWPSIPSPGPTWRYA